MIDHNAATPLYVQIEQEIRDRIARGEWSPGNRIPSEKSLNEMFGVSRMTVRGVLTTLVDSGVLHRVPGKGTFVSESKIEARSPAYQGIREQLEEMGLETETELLALETVTPDERLRKKLNLGYGIAVYHIVRRRLVKGVPVSLHSSYVPTSLAPGLDGHDVVDQQLCVVLEKEFHLKRAVTRETLEAVGAYSEEASLLDLPGGSPILLLEDSISDSSGRVFEYSKICFRGDRVSLSFEYTED
ncbi:GntR family transcriptional regulator [Actinomycetaceae bacterium MB13-C1-2]|nr:GntR family transcriptional regulator [Actinomycetaceae bacterium MB13-C1-2]